MIIKLNNDSMELLITITLINFEINVILMVKDSPKMDRQARSTLAYDGGKDRLEYSD